MAPSVYESMLVRTNYYREQHDAPDLVWNRTLAKAAGMWASNCVFEHDNTTDQGENLYELSGGASDTLAASYVLRQAVDSWYGEVQDYDYLQPENTSAAAHFTQLVWEATQSVGCNITDCPDSRLVVCRYWPPGNVDGEAAVNVFYPVDPGNKDEAWPAR